MKMFSEFFAALDQQDNLVFLLFLLIAFLIGYLLSWLVYARQAARWRKKAAQTEAEWNALQAEYHSFKEQYALREADLQHAQVEAEDARRQAQQFRQERNRSEAELEETQAELIRLESTVTAQQVTIEDLNDQILGLRTKNQQLLQDEPAEEPVAAVSSGGLDAALHRLASVEERLQKIESENEALRLQLAETPIARPVQSPVEQLFDLNEEELDEEKEEQERIAQARAALQSAFGVLLPVATEAEKDDLQQIQGIGPFLEKQLNEEGIYTFQQVSRLDEVLIEHLTTAIRFFPGRIQKDDWVGQAARFLENPPPPAEAEEELPTADNFQEIEGIGPKIETLLHEAGLRTYRQLADASMERLQEILHAAGDRFRLHDPTTWPDQAGLAADGKWEELREYQKYLNGGE
jgi:predicted flap endonuclease-1-like 5' DNA nuclease